MSKTPGRPPESSPFKKTQLSSDAKIIIALIKMQPQSKEEICEKTKVSDRTFYRIISLLEKQKITKSQDHMYSLWNFDFTEKTIQDALTKLTQGTTFATPNQIANEVGKPWPEIQAATYKIAHKLGLTITQYGNQTIIVKIS